MTRIFLYLYIYIIFIFILIFILYFNYFLYYVRIISVVTSWKERKSASSALHIIQSKDILTPHLVQGNRNSIPLIFGGPILFNNLVIKICWISHSTFLDYYGIGLKSHSMPPPQNWLFNPSRNRKKNYSILSLPNAITSLQFLPNLSFLTSLQLLHYFTTISPSYSTITSLLHCNFSILFSITSL